MIHVNPSKMQNRRACDRCHQAKLKCVVEDSPTQSQKCRRCKRTNTDCVFSPPSRTRVNRRSQLQVAGQSSLSPQSDGSLANADFSWSDVVDMNLDTDLNVPLEASLLASFHLDPELRLDTTMASSLHNPFDYEIQNQNRDRPVSTPNQPSCENESMPCLSARTMSTGTSSTYVPSMAGSTGAFQAAYDDILSTSRQPTLPGHRYTIGEYGNVFASAPAMLPSPEREPSLEKEESPPPTNIVFWVERVTALNVQFTQHLQTIPRVNPESLQLEPEQDTQSGTFPTPSKRHNSDSTFQLSEAFIELLSAMCSKLPPPVQQDSGARRDSNSHAYLCLDEASRLLIFSTYMRLLEVHDTVFRYLLSCLVHKRDNVPQGAGSCFYLPKLTIGSFSLATTSETRPLLFVSFMESLLSRARNLMHRVSSNGSPMQSRKGTPCGKSPEELSFGGLPPIIDPELAMQSIRARETAISNLVERIKSALARMGVN
ncbi:hypothetical protein V8F33_002197 [Rhypophila sp. PSN 637]